MATSKRTTNTEPGDVAEPVAPADDVQAENSTEPADGAVVEGDFNIVQPLQGLDGMPLPLDAKPVEMIQDPESGAIVAAPADDETEKDVTRDDR